MDTSTLPPPPAAPTPPGARPRPSRGARIAWKAVASMAAAFVLVWGAAQAVAQLAHEEHTTVATYEAAALTLLDVRIDRGSLTVVGSDSDVVKVTAHISDGLRSTTERQTVDGDRLVLRGACPALLDNFCSVAYTVEMPSDMALWARLGNDDIHLTGVGGDVDAHTDNGDVDLRGSGAGALRLGSDNGDVIGVDLRAAEVDADSDNGDVSLTFARSPFTVEATSDNGDVSVALPDDGAAYAVSTGSANGSTAAPIRTDPDSRRTITAKSDHGDVQITYLTR